MNRRNATHPGSSSPAPSHAIIDLKQKDKDDPPCKCSHGMSEHHHDNGPCKRPGCGCQEYR